MAMGRRNDRARTPSLSIATNESPPTGGGLLALEPATQGSHQQL
jgi:hypothetical protein